MANSVEEVVRVGLAGWIGEGDDPWDAPRVLGVMGELYLVEIDEGNRERVLLELIDRHEIDTRNSRLELVLFGSTGSVFASSLSYFQHWPRSSANLPADVLIDDRYRATFAGTDDEIVVTVRHALRSSDVPPQRRLRFRQSEYEQAIAELSRESQRLREDLLALAQRRAPEKVESLREALGMA